MPKPPLNYTTTIVTTRSAGECVQLLAEAGATAVTLTYEDGRPAGIGFRLMFAGQPRDFSMPVDIGGVHELLKRADFPSNYAASVRAKWVTRQHAERVGWRIVKDWIEAQLAIIQAGMVTLDQVMLPYLQVEHGSLYQAVRERATLAALDA